MEEVQDEQQIRALLARIEARDQRALRELHGLFARRIYAFALRRIGKPDEAETIVSDTLLEVWKYPTRFRGESKFSTWLLGIARNKMLMLLRQRGPVYEELDEAMPDEDLGSFDIFANKQLAEGLLRCMDGLSQVHRECLHLVLFEELSLEEIAGIQGCPENTVKTRLFHARKNIKECVGKLVGMEA